MCLDTHTHTTLKRTAISSPSNTALLASLQYIYIYIYIYI